jgi:hypothetical protein
VDVVSVEIHDLMGELLSMDIVQLNVHSDRVMLGIRPDLGSGSYTMNLLMQDKPFRGMIVID